jgi:hypothetical protein
LEQLKTLPAEQLFCLFIEKAMQGHDVKVDGVIGERKIYGRPRRKEKSLGFEERGPYLKDDPIKGTIYDSKVERNLGKIIPNYEQILPYLNLTDMVKELLDKIRTLFIQDLIRLEEIIRQYPRLDNRPNGVNNIIYEASDTSWHEETVLHTRQIGKLSGKKCVIP